MSDVCSMFVHRSGSDSLTLSSTYSTLTCSHASPKGCHRFDWSGFHSMGTLPWCIKSSSWPSGIVLWSWQTGAKVHKLMKLPCLSLNWIQLQMSPVELETDQVGSSINGSDLYSGGVEFTFWLKHQLLQVRFYMFFLIPSIHMSWYLKLVLGHFLPHPFHLTVH